MSNDKNWSRFRWTFRHFSAIIRPLNALIYFLLLGLGLRYSELRSSGFWVEVVEEPWIEDWQSQFCPRMTRILSFGKRRRWLGYAKRKRWLSFGKRKRLLGWAKRQSRMWRMKRIFGGCAIGEHRFLAAPSGKAEQRGFRRISTDSFRLDVDGCWVMG